MPFVEEFWNNTTSPCKNWHKKIKWFIIFIKPNKCQKNRKEKQKWKNLPGPYLRPSPVLAQHCAAWPGPTGQASHPPPRPTLGLASPDLSEASRAADWTPPHRRCQIDVARLQRSAVASRPSQTVSHSSFPCAYDILDLQ